MLMRIVSRIKEGMTLKEAYCKPVTSSRDGKGTGLDERDQEQMMSDRMRLRRYLMELAHH